MQREEAGRGGSAHAARVGDSEPLDKPSSATRLIRRAAADDVATAAFVALSVLATLTYVVIGRDQWFFQDEWAFLAGRDGGSLSGLLEPHNEHLSTVPVILYRLLWNVFGIRTYAPYQAMSIGMHLVTAWLLWALMRRSKVSGWPATVAAGVFLCFGAGYQNIVWGFQIGFVGGIAGGLACLLLADGPPSRRRTAAAIGAGAFGLLSSGTGLVVVSVAVVTVALRHGVRRGAAIGVPLAVPYAAWWLAYQERAGRNDEAAVTEILRFAQHGLTAAAHAVGPWRPVTAAIVIAASAGIAIVAYEPPRTIAAWRERLGVPVMLAAGAIGFLLVTGRSRVSNFGIEFAERSRYLHLVVACSTPALGLGIEGLRRRARPIALAVGTVLIASMPMTIRDAEVSTQRGVSPGTLVALARSPAVHPGAPDAVLYPDLAGARSITVAWLQRADDEGRLPDVTPSPRDEIDAMAMVAVALSDDPVPDPDPAECRGLARPAEVEIGPDKPIVILGTVSVRIVADDLESIERPLSTAAFRQVGASTEITIRLSADPDDFAVWCRTDAP